MHLVRPMQSRPAKIQKTTVSKEDYTCPICMEPYLHLVGQCRHGHLICTACWHKLTTKPKICPSCRVPMPEFIRNRAVENIAGRIEIKCKWRECTQVVPLKEMYKHQNKCAHKAQPCGMVDCNWEGYEDEFLAHLKTKHENKTFTLETNMLEITLGDTLEDHSSRTIIYKKKFYFLHCHVLDEESGDGIFVCTVKSLTEADKLRFRLTLHDGNDKVCIETLTCSVDESKYDVDTSWKKMLIHRHELADARGPQEGGRHLVLEFL